MLGPTAYPKVEKLRSTVEIIEARRHSGHRRLLNGFTRHRLAQMISALDQIHCAVPEQARAMANGFA